MLPPHPLPSLLILEPHFSLDHLLITSLNLRSFKGQWKQFLGLDLFRTVSAFTIQMNKPDLSHP